MTFSKTARSAGLAAARGVVGTIVLAAAVLPGLALSAPSARAPNTVSIDNFTFTPQTLTVKAGATVIWTNNDDIPHGIAATGNSFAKSKALDTDDTYSFTFTTPGVYKYFCYIHPHMVGTIVVEAATGSNATQ